MKVDFDCPILSIEGEVLKEQGVVVTVRLLCARALACDLETDKDTPEQKVLRFSLAEKIFTTQNLSMTEDNFQMIEKRLSGGIFSTTAFCRVKNVFDEARALNTPTISEA